MAAKYTGKCCSGGHDPGFREICAMSTVSKPQPVRTSTRFNVISAALAFFIWGSWAWFVNAQSASPDKAPPVVSGLVQGTGSCLITLVMLRSVTWLFHCLEGFRLRLVLPAVVTTSVTGSCISAAHFLAGTSNIVGTVTPGLVVAFCFNVFTAVKLSQIHANSDIPAEQNGRSS